MDWLASEPGICQAPLPHHWDRDVYHHTQHLCRSCCSRLEAKHPMESPNPVTFFDISIFKLIALPNINTGKSSLQLQWLWNFPAPLKTVWPYPRTRKWCRHIFSKTTWARDSPQCWMLCSENMHLGGKGLTVEKPGSFLEDVSRQSWGRCIFQYEPKRSMGSQYMRMELCWSQSLFLFSREVENMAFNIKFLW